MRIFKKILAFIVINALMVALLNFALTPASRMKIKVKDFKNGDFNELILGYSFSEVGMNPYLLSEGNRKVYNMARGGSSVQTSYYLLKMLDRYSDIQRIYFDIDFDYWTKTQESVLIRGEEDNTIQGLLPLDMQIEFIANELMTYEFYHSFANYKINSLTVKGIPRNIKNKLSPNYRSGNPQAIADILAGIGSDSEYIGNGYTARPKPTQLPPEIGLIAFSPDTVSPAAIECFDRIVAYCKKNNIEMICYSTPLPPARIINDKADLIHEYFNDLCESRGVPYYDMNYLKWNYLPRTAEDYVDYAGHMVDDLAETHTKLFKEIINSAHPEEYFEQTYEDVLDGIKTEGGAI